MSHIGPHHDEVAAALEFFSRNVATRLSSAIVIGTVSR